ncbi:MAG: PDZ domain-containing protein [Pirellulaceae bacterium]
MNFRWMLVVAIYFLPAMGKAQGPAIPASNMDAKSTSDWIDQLSAASFGARQMARIQILRQQRDGLPELEAALDQADADLSWQLISILSDLAADPNAGPGPEALAVLQRTAKSPRSHLAELARRSLDSLGYQQRRVVERELVQMGAFAGYANIQVITVANQELFHLRIDEDFTGNAEDLRRLQWLHGIEMLILEGEQVDRQWLLQASKMPNLRILQLRRTRLNQEDLKQLHEFPRLETLELIYSSIGDESIDTLVELPVWGNLRLFGTRISPDGFSQLAEKLTDIELVYGRGGYLGVSIRDLNGVVISETIAGGAAQQAGLMPDDRLLAINQQPLLRFEDLRKELSKFAPGDSIEVLYERTDLGSGRVAQDTALVILGEQP